jgi:poly(A) polymerase
MKLNPDWLAWKQTQKLIKAFADAGKSAELRFVGGAVRDSLLGINVSDVDAATTLTPQAVMELLQQADIRAIPTGIKHGTITAAIDGKNFEITTLRRDTACDGRHAEVEFTDNWQEDAARRDFAMNALYLSADGELFDYFFGADDARAGRVRFIGDARQRITEDYLRILRFFRFFAYYGKNDADKTALAACSEFAEKIESLSGERIQHEMLKLLAAPAPFSTLALMQNAGVLKQIFGFDICLRHPELVEGSLQNKVKISRIARNDKIFSSRPRNKCGVTMLAFLLLNAEIPPVDALNILADRWRLSNDLKRYLLTIATHINDISANIPTSRQKQLIRKLGAEIFSDIILLKQELQPRENYSEMLALAENWQIPIMPVSGKDLIELGIPEGKILGEKLHKLEKIWEESDYKFGKEDLYKHIG